MFTYSRLLDPTHSIPLVLLRSILVLDNSSNTLAYFQELKAVAFSPPQDQHGWNPVPPTSITPSPPPPYSHLDPNHGMSRRGWNTFHGPDAGPPPPGVGGTPPMQFPWVQMQPQMQFAVPPPAQFIYPPPAIAAAAPPMFYPGQMPAMQPTPAGGWTHPAPPPTTNPLAPGVNINFRNHTGGVGVPPGYDYAFPTEHCMIHVFINLSQPPWQGPLFPTPANHMKLAVPVKTTIKDFMQQMGCTNEDAGKNKMAEIVEAGNGIWKKGLEFNGGDKDRMKKMIKDFGWDGSRKDGPGERGVVWVWCTKG